MIHSHILSRQTAILAGQIFNFFSENMSFFSVLNDLLSSIINHQGVIQSPVLEHGIHIAFHFALGDAIVTNGADLAGLKIKPGINNLGEQ